MLPEGLTPKLLICLRTYSARDFARDVLAGVTVGVVALPLAMAFAIASGLTPQSGIYCAIVTGFLISALGGSRMQIGGPTGAFVVVVAGIISQHGVDGLFMCTMMAGVLLVILGLTGMGSAVDATGLHALESLADQLHASGRTLILCGARSQPAWLMEQAEFHEHVGDANICPHIEAALARAAQIRADLAVA